MNLWLVLLTGLTTGGLSCTAVQGGLLASVIASQKEHENSGKKAPAHWKTLDQQDWVPVGVFLAAKLVSHTILGFALGALGGVFTLNLGWKLAFQIAAGVFMLATAANLLQLHPAFRWLTFQPPRAIRRYITTSGKKSGWIAPAILGVLTVFIPCGVTQAMEVLAISSGNPWSGAAIMGTFVLGTSPLFGILGVMTSRLSETHHQRFTQVTAAILILLGGYSVLTAGRVALATANANPQTQQQSRVTNPAAAQNVTIQVMSRGYQPSRIQVQRNVPVNLTLVSKDTYSCALDFVFPAFGIKKMLRATDRQTFTFVPTQPGKYTFSCSMGMYTGVMEVL